VQALRFDVAMAVTTEAVQIFGGYGYMKEYPVEKNDAGTPRSPRFTKARAKSSVASSAKHLIKESAGQEIIRIQQP